MLDAGDSGRDVTILVFKEQPGERDREGIYNLGTRLRMSIMQMDLGSRKRGPWPHLEGRSAGTSQQSDARASLEECVVMSEADWEEPQTPFDARCPFSLGWVSSSFNLR